MDNLQETDDQLRESLEHLLGLSVSSPPTLESNIQSSEETQRHIRHQCFLLKSKLNDKDRTFERVRAELSMNAKAKKKFAEENQQLTVDRDDLLTQYAKWDNECTLYEHHIEDLMDLGNQAYERAKEAEAREEYLEDEIIKLLEELESFKQVSEGECNENLLIHWFRLWSTWMKLHQRHTRFWRRVVKLMCAKRC
ncbi:uncharacterized protein LOC143580600 [Bidens hawaiensis]|uniref:uncharacterized protein LOC143580600 n=1 Tax=Bidens hawaiensis TaxID=980011 RepID=UPI00404B2D12